MSIQSVIEYLKAKDLKEIDQLHYNGGERLAGCYVLIHEASGLAYVGSTGNLYKRIVRHRSNLKYGTHPNVNLQKVYNENPEIKYVVFITSTKDEATDLEQELLDIFLEHGVLANIEADARLPPKTEMTTERREMFRRLSLGRTMSVQARELIRQSKLGKPRDDQTKKKLSAALKGRPLSPEHRDKVAKALIGREKPDHLCRAVVVNGVKYKSFVHAAKEHNLNPTTAKRRVLSDKFPNWQYAA